MPSISKRGTTVPTSPFRKLLPLAEAAKAKGRKIYHLNIGQPDILTPKVAMDAVRSADMKVLEYSQAEGNPSYRQKLTAYYRSFGVELNVEHIIVTTGASEAIQLALMACLDPADEIIVPEPFYANYNGFSHIAHTQIIPITCDIADGFALPKISDFERVITPKTKAIFITNPNNPTGCFYSRETLEALGQLVKDYDLFLMVDEVYREFCYDGQEFYSALRLEACEDHVIGMDSISKRYSACGARVGAVVTQNKTVLESISRFAKLRLSPPAFGQILAEATLDMDGTYLREVQEEYRKRRDIVYARLSQMPGVVSYLPGGAFYCFAKFPIDSAERFCRWLLEEFEYQGATVMLSPGDGFYATPGLGKDEVRIAYVLNVADLDAAMDCLEAALNIYPGLLQRANKEAMNIG